MGLRLTSFFVLLIVLYVRVSSANSYQGLSQRTLAPRDNTGVVQARGTPTNFEKETLDGVPSAASVEDYPSLVGRKMMIKRHLEMVKKTKDLKISGPSHSISNCSLQKNGILDEECRRLRNKSGRRLKAKMDGFVAFNADYHVPRPHPPKNN